VSAEPEGSASLHRANLHVGWGENAALAFDPADHALWLNTAQSNLLRQYSLDGATFGDLLQAGTPNGLPRRFFESGEFKEVVPEPSTLLLLATVLIGYADAGLT